MSENSHKSITLKEKLSIYFREYSLFTGIHGVAFVAEKRTWCEKY